MNKSYFLLNSNIKSNRESEKVKLSLYLVEQHTVNMWGCQLHVPPALLPVSAHNACWIGGWVGPRASLDAVEQREISCPCQEFSNECLSVQSVAVLAEGCFEVVISLNVCAVDFEGQLDRLSIIVIVEVTLWQRLLL
jgi:hypothetical protein